MNLFDGGSMKAKAEKASAGGSIRLVDSSMKAKAGKLLLTRPVLFILFRFN